MVLVYIFVTISVVVRGLVPADVQTAGKRQMFRHVTLPTSTGRCFMAWSPARASSVAAKPLRCRYKQLLGKTTSTPSAHYRYRVN